LLTGQGNSPNVFSLIKEIKEELKAEIESGQKELKSEIESGFRKVQNTMDMSLYSSGMLFIRSINHFCKHN